MSKILPILYSFRRCPYAMRARMGLKSAGIPAALREVVLRDKPAHMLEISHKGTVPVLMLDDGRVIDESLEILFWALNQHDPDGLMDVDLKDAKALIAENDGAFKKALDRYKYPGRYPDEDCSGARDDGEAFIQTLNDRLGANQHLSSPNLSIADIAIFPFIRQFAHVDKDWFFTLPYPALQRWLTDRLESDLFLSVMKKYPQWTPNDTPVIF